MKRFFLTFLLLDVLFFSLSLSPSVFAVSVVLDNSVPVVQGNLEPLDLYALAVMSYSGTWDKKAYYESQSMVLFNKCFYLALNPNKELRPDKNKSVWLKIACH